MSKLAIDTDYMLRILEKLLSIPSPSGHTDEIVRFCCAELSNLGIEHYITRRGAIRGILAGDNHAPARSVISHVDTLGAQIKRLKDNGRMELVPIGHWNARFAEGARTTIFKDFDRARGTILPLKASGHTFNDEIDTQPSAWNQLELRPDAEATCAEDLEKLGFHIGDFVAIDPQPEFTEAGFINSRHLDNKGGVASMFAALKALVDGGINPPVDTYFLFSITEEVGVGASAILHGDIASMVTIDNGTPAPGQNSSEKGVTIAMADSQGPFDFHLTHKLLGLCREEKIDHQRDIFRYYRCDSASAIEAGNDIRASLITFGVDASHGHERTHVDSLRSVAELVTVYTQSRVEIPRDAHELAGLSGFPEQQ